MTKRILLPFIVAAAVSLLITTPACKKNPRPNVVVIVIDCLRADRLPFYGYAKNTMPFLNRMARGSSVFARAYSESSWTVPAAASIFTGLYPFQHGLTRRLSSEKRDIGKNPSFRFNTIPGRLQTLPEVFKANGYRTFGISDNLNISKRQGFDQGFDRLLTYTHEGARIVNRALLAMEREIRASPRYFLYLHYMDAHLPYKLSLDPGERTGGRFTDLQLIYDKELTLIDRCLGELFRHFGWEKNTLIVVTADHGEEMGERGYYGHGRTLFNTVIHVPLLFHFPDCRGVHPGTSHAEVSTLDILPTLSGFMGFGGTGDLSGMDLGPFLEDPSARGGERPIYSHLYSHQKPLERKVVYWTAIANGYKYMSQSDREFGMLFNLNEDPLEGDDRSFRDPAHVRKLAGSYFNFTRGCVRFNPDHADIRLGKKDLDHLKALGYL